MATRNISKEKRERLILKIEEIKKNADDETIAVLNEIENELNRKKYGLVWEEHLEKVDVEMLTKIPVFTEDKTKEIVVSDEAYNFMLEGDNLHSLRLLEKTHKGKIDVIYIDPPYNTQNKDFVYDDTIVDLNDGFRHSKWASFIYERLRIAAKLLAEDGCIFISIDDNEQATLKMLCDEVFGDRNFVAQLVWEKKKKGSFLSKSISNIKEYVLVYAKNIDAFPGLVGQIKTATETYPCINAGNKREIRRIPAGIKSNYSEKNYYLPQGSVISDTTMSLVLHSDLVIKDGVLNQELLIEGNWRYSQDAMYEYAINKELYLTRDLYLRRIVSSPRNKKMKDLLPRVGDDKDVKYNDDINPNDLFQSGWGSNEDADEELRVILGKQKMFDYPKPTRLLIKLLASTRKPNALCLDFFAGSGTMGHAVMRLNEIDGGKRRFILCTNNEGNICETITYPRIRTVITGLRSDGSKYSDGLPANLKYYKTDYIDKIRDGSVPHSLLNHVRELIQLEMHCRIDNQTICLALTEDELDAIIESNLSTCKRIYIASEVLLSSKQMRIIDDNAIELIDIPEYYFSEELREVDEV